MAFPHPGAKLEFSEREDASESVTWASMEQFCVGIRSQISFRGVNLFRLPERQFISASPD